MKEFKRFSNWLFYISLFCLVLAAYGAFAGSDLWLAPTQWLLVATAFVVYAIYLKQE